MATGELIGRRAPDASGAPDDARGEPVPPARSRWWGRAALVLTLVPLVVSAVYLRLVHADYRNVGDLSLTELQVRSVGHHWVELGAFSRDGWFHLGPAQFYALAPLYRLLGSIGINLHVAALALNAAAVTGMAVVARRRGGLPLALVTLVAVALTVRTLGPDPIRLAWNPYLPVLAYGLVVFLAWAMACGERWALPVAVAVASFAAQTHIAYVPLALPLVALGAVWLVVATPSGSRRRLVVPALVALGAAALMWLPPAVQEVTNSPGNLREVASWFRAGGANGDDPAGLGDAWRVVVTSQWSVPPEWAFGMRPVWWTAAPASLHDPRPPVLLVLPIVAGAYLIRRRIPGAAQLVAVWSVANVVALVATARTVGGLYAYRTGYTMVLGMVGGVIVGWAGWTAAEAWRPRAARVLVPAAATALAVLAVVSSVAHVRAGEPEEVDSELARNLGPALVEGLPPGEGAVVVSGESWGATGFKSAVVLALDDAGIDAYLTPGDAGAGRHNMYRGDGPVRARLVVGTDLEIDHFLDGGMQMIAYSGSMPLDELRRRAPATERLRDRQESGDPAAFGREAEEGTVPPRTAVAVFLEQ